MKSALAVPLLAAAALAAGADAGRTALGPEPGITVSAEAERPLPARNLLPEGFCDFATNVVFSDERKSVWRTAGKLVEPGRAYVLSCEIKPSADVSAKRLAGAAGLGCSLTYWDADWKRAVSISARGEGSGTWRRVVSEKVTMPDWIGPGQLTVGLAYTGGSGEVRNIELTEAGCALAVEARSDKGVAQVKIVDENLATVFDTGVLDGADAVWTGRVEADAARRYAVYAIDAEGEVAMKRIGEEK